MQNHDHATPVGEQSLLAAARAYGAKGWKVFPCQPGGKSPMTPNGHKDATSDERQIREWWTRTPDANIGLSCKASGLVVLDADTYKPDCQWTAVAAGLELPATLEQRSARGGMHYFYEAEVGATYAAAPWPGVDVKHSGYVLLEPSRFADGRYEFRTDDVVAPAPEWLPAGSSAPRSVSTSTPTVTPLEIAWVIDRLNTSENTLQRDDWVKLGLAVKETCGEVAREAFIAFSYKWPGGEAGEPERVWDTARPNGSLSLGTVKHFLGSEGVPKNVEFDLSEDSLALELGRDAWDQNAKYVAAWNKWLFWDGSRWVKDEKRKAFTESRNFLRRKAQALIDWADEKAATEPDPQKLLKWADGEARAMRSNGRVTSIETLARSNAASAASAEEFDGARMLLGTPDGTVDLSSGILRAAKRSDMLTKAVAVGPASSAASPKLWLEFLDRIFDGDQEVIRFVQRLCGYALTGRTDEQKLFFLHGSGANGKSVFLNTLVWLLSDYGKRAPAESFLMTSGEQHPTNIALMQGARLVVGSELPKGKTWNDSVIKDLTGGDRMTARFMRGDFFEFDPQLTLMIAGNTKPNFGAVDDAMKRRIVLIPFAVTIPPEERDGRLEERLQTEGPEILRWFIQGAQDWASRGLAIPKTIRAASADYLEEEDTIGQFLSDCTVATVSGFVPNSDLRSRYEAWCVIEGEKEMGRKSFFKSIEERGFTSEKRTGGIRGKAGLVLK